MSNAKVELLESKYAEILMRFIEIKSSLLILQYAVKNEDEVITLSNVDDTLGIIIESINTTIKQLNDTMDEQFVQNRINQTKN